MKRFSHPDSECMKRLNSAAKNIVEHRYNQLGYPFDQGTELAQFYRWLADTGLADITLINVGDPYKTEWHMLNTDYFERACIDFIADHCGFGGNHWGVLANGGSDGNMHGIYFGRKALAAQCPDIQPILYVSDEAHYSVKKIGDIQNIETRTVRAGKMGAIDAENLYEKIDPKRPALVVMAIGGTFKGAIDNPQEVLKAIDAAKPVAVYKHADAALFGGYLPFLEDQNARDILNSEKSGFDSLAISGHKFLALNEPAGIFICRKQILNCVQENPVPYLNGVIPTLNCSRSGFDPLKLYWRIMSLGEDGLREQAEHCLNMAKLLERSLGDAGVRARRNELSNTVFFPRPNAETVAKYALACGVDSHFGELSHIVTMQYFTPELIEKIVADIASGSLGR